MEIPKNENIEDALISFVKSEQFNNFKKIMENMAYQQFKENMSKERKTYDLMLYEKDALALYIKMPSFLENKVKSIEKRMEIEMAENIAKAQRLE